MNATSSSYFLCGDPFMPISLVFQRGCRDLLHNRIRAFLPSEEQRLQVIKQMQRAKRGWGGGECSFVVRRPGASNLI